MNIRRSVQIVGTMELFKYFLLILRELQTPRLTVFIDQFEEYVEYQRGSYQLKQLANDIKNIIRMCTETQNVSFLVTIHPTSQSYLWEAGRDILSTYGDIMDTAVTVPKFEVPHLVKIAEEHLQRFRKGRPESEAFPFTEDALKLVADHSNNNARTFLGFLHDLMIDAVEQNVERLDVMELHKLRRGLLIAAGKNR